MDYYAPESLSEALDILGRGGVTPLSGGTDFYPALTPGGPRQSLLDITRIAALHGISRQAGGWRIGAATTWSEIARAELPPAFDGLRAAAREVGARQIQNVGTVGGNICNASPAADGVPPLLTLDAEVEIAAAGGTRRMALSGFVTGVRQVALKPGEMVVALHLPDPPETAVGAFRKLGSRAYLVISIAMVAMVLRRDGAGRVDHARIAVGACSPVAQRLGALETALIGARPEEVRVTMANLGALQPIDDVRGSAAYRLDAVREVIARMLREAGDG
ncbi:FAD binding domain-containing protein [Marimonas arenosa]|uniref:Xanthine dehydrogenase family protein subunit M n=1 Tax=Marimonas arenosa TaxID=1795305 RepID=A0AAE3WC49_9RHOB|nr:xanthine dehydrogenase family protein subunit M [Marimonas arenosa]MDQ2089982.1 xanthine dehydrogenase family protein subunit M [Marimonas arenosa]